MEARVKMSHLQERERGGDYGTHTRSSLLWNTVEIVRITQPTYVIWENVKNVLSKKHIHTFEAYLKALDELGYNSDYQVLNAKDYGIPQNRQRIYCISTLRSSNLGKFIFPQKMKLELRLKDLLEDKVDEKYYLSEKMVKYISSTGSKNYKNNDCKINLEVSRPLTTHIEKRAGTSNYISENLPENYDLKYLKVKEATKKGYAEAFDGDGVYIDRPHEKRGVVQKNMIPTLKTSGNDIAVVLNEPKVLTNNNLRIRKLTPKECFRLMGFDDEDVDILIENDISNTQLYKMAGNSIVVNVLVEIFKELLINKNFKKEERIQQLKLFD